MLSDRTWPWYESAEELARIVRERAKEFAGVVIGRECGEFRYSLLQMKAGRSHFIRKEDALALLADAGASGLPVTERGPPRECGCGCAWR